MNFKLNFLKNFIGGGIMKSQNPYKDANNLLFFGGSGFCWEFDDETSDILNEEEYNSFLADVYEYRAELYEPYIS